MNEPDLINCLGSLSDDPVDPPDELRHDLWALIEPQLSVPPTRITRNAPGAEADGEDESLVPHTVSRRRRVSGGLAAAAAFLIVIALGAVTVWLQPRGIRDPVADDRTWPPTTAAVDERSDIASVVVDDDGTLTLPEGLVPAAITDAENGLVVVVAEGSSRDDGAPPAEEGTVLVIERTGGQVRWQVDLGGGPSMVVTSQEGVWVAHYWTGAVTKLDPATGEILATAVIELPYEFSTGEDARRFVPSDLEVAFGSLWLSGGGSIAEVDLDSGAVVAVTGLYSDVNGLYPEEVLALPGDIAASDRHLWVAADVAGVFVLDPEDHSTEIVDVHALDHSAESLAFHNGRMFVAGNRLGRDAGGSLIVSAGSYVSGEDSQVTALDPDTLTWLEARELPTPTARLGVLGDQLLAFDGSGAAFLIDDENVVAGPPIRVGALDTMEVGATGETLWLIDRNARALRPVTLEALMAAAISTAPGAEGPTVLWRREGIGMLDWALATSGRLVLVDDERVYLADGFAGPEEEHNVAAVARTTGETVWTRDDLTRVDDAAFVSPPFLQAIVGETLIVNGQYHIVHAVDAATGDSRWTVRLPDGYGAIASVYTDDTLVVTADAQGEGDTQPPLVYGLDPIDGSQRWQTALVDGTDLLTHPPAALSGLVLVPSTLSHTGSASGNMVHAVSVATGQVVWATNLGGGTQALHEYPVLTDGSRAFVRGPEGTVALDLANGTQLWQSPGTWPLVMTPDGDALVSVGNRWTDGNGGILRLDPATGNATVLVDAGVLTESPIGATVRDGTAITMTTSGLTGFDLTDGTLLWSWTATAPLVDVAAVTSDFAAVPTADRSAVGLVLP